MSIIPNRSMPSWFYKLGHINVQIVRRLPLETARTFVKLKFPELSQDEYEGVLTVAGTAYVNQVQLVKSGTDPHRKLFVTAAWLCGASLAQLGAMYGVARQSIGEQVNRAFFGVDRNALRIRPGGELTDKILEEMKALYYGMVEENPHAFENMNLLEVAQLLDTGGQPMASLPRDHVPTIDFSKIKTTQPEPMPVDVPDSAVPDPDDMLDDDPDVPASRLVRPDDTADTM